MGFAAKVSQEGYDVETCEDRRLIFSSDFQTLKVFSAQQYSDKIPSGSSANFTANASNDTLTSAAHGLSNGDVVNFTTSGTLPAPLQEYDTGALYYVINATTNTYKVSEVKAGASINITNAGSGTHTWYNDESKLVIPHGLGYFSPFMVVYNGSSRSGQNSSYFFSDSAGSPLVSNCSNDTEQVEIHVYEGFDDPNSQPGDTIYFTVYIFLDDFSTIAEKTVNTSTASGGSAGDFSFKISKEGYDVTTCANIDCIITSETPTHIVHKKGNGTDSTISHNLTYVPSFLAYIENDGRIYMTDSTISDTELIMGYGASGTYYYIIFKNKNG